MSTKLSNGHIQVDMSYRWKQEQRWNLTVILELTAKKTEKPIPGVLWKRLQLLYNILLPPPDVLYKV